jgi:hypothetical protein
MGITRPGRGQRRRPPSSPRSANGSEPASSATTGNCSSSSQRYPWPTASNPSTQPSRDSQHRQRRRRHRGTRHRHRQPLHPSRHRPARRPSRRSVTPPPARSRPASRRHRSAVGLDTPELSAGGRQRCPPAGAGRAIHSPDWSRPMPVQVSARIQHRLFEGGGPIPSGPHPTSSAVRTQPRRCRRNVCCEFAPVFNTCKVTKPA